MTDPDTPVRRLVVAVDVHQYSRRRALAQVDTQNDLLEALDEAAGRSGLDRSKWYKQQQGDAEVAVLPPDAAEPVVVADFVRELCTRLSRVNHSPDPASRLRLRMSVHCGLVHFGSNGLPGPGAVEACRFLDAEPFKKALADSDADLALIVSPAIFHDIVSPGYRGLRGVDFAPLPVTVKEFSGTGYVRLYGGPGAGSTSIGSTPPTAAPESSAPPSAAPGVRPGRTWPFSEHAQERLGGTTTNIGALSMGEGDAVNGDKYDFRGRDVR